MKAKLDEKDIRIGNWFRHKANKWSYRVGDSAEHPFYFQWEYNDWHAIGECTLNLEDIEPIELTLDILVKAGFTKDGFGAYAISIGDFEWASRILVYVGDYLYIREHRDDERHEDDDVITIWNKDVRKQFYLHELQNTFFDLTRRELQITGL